MFLLLSSLLNNNYYYSKYLPKEKYLKLMTKIITKMCRKDLTSIGFFIFFNQNLILFEKKKERESERDIKKNTTETNNNIKIIIG